MSTTVENRVISMKFDNDEFEKRAGQTLKTIADLNKSMTFDGAKRGLSDIGAAAKNVSLSGIAQGVEDLKSKFSALSVVGITALANIANRAVDAGLRITKSLTIGPIAEGFADYNTKLTSVQTIMNATGADIKTVNGFFKQLDTYSDKTIYNLSDMTGAFAKFTNAGVDMDKSVPAIKGIANMVALAGQDANAASIAMYNLSQSIAGGFLTTTDYKSLNLANVATKEWKTQMIEGAVAAGTLKKNSQGLYAIKGTKKALSEQALFTEGLADQWATTDVLMKVLGDYGNVQTDIGKKAQAAAQNVKSLPMMMDTLKASVGTGWTDSFEFILGNVEESTKLFTGMTNAIQGVLDKSAQSRNHMLHQWKDLGGRTAIIDAVRNAWNALGAVLKPIGDAWRSVFPPGGLGESLAKFSFKLREITSHLMIGKDTAENLKRTFQGVFALFKIGTTILGGLLKGFFSIFGVIGSGGGGMIASLLSITAVVGDFLVKIQKLLVESGAIKAFFTLFLSPLAVIKPLIGFVIQLADALIALGKGDISGFHKKLETAFGGLGKIFDEIQAKVHAFVDLLSMGLNSIGGYLGGFASNVQRTGGSVAQMFGGWASAVSVFIQGFTGGTLAKVSQTIDRVAGSFSTLRGAMNFHADLGGMKGQTDQLAKLGAVAAALGSVWRGVVNAFKGVGNALAPITSALNNFFTTLVKKLTDFISGMDMQDAVALVNTGFFIAMYLAFRKFLTMMSGLVGDISQMVQSISGVFGQLKDTLKAMQQEIQSKTILRIAAAVAILTASVVALSLIDPKRLGIALAALTTLFIQLGAAMKFMDFDQKGMLGASASLVMIAGAITVLTGAVAILGHMNPKALIQGLIGVGTILAGLTLFMKFAEVSQGGIKAGAGLILLATAINMLVISVAALGNMAVGTLVKGITSIAAMLTILVVAVNGMTAGLRGATAVAIIAGALVALTPVLIALGLLPYETLLKGLGAIAIGLGLLSIAANTMTAALPGAGAIVIMAAALAILTPVIITLGNLDAGTIFKSMITIAAALTILSIAANSMDAALPGAAALLAVAGALLILTPVLVTLGQMSWGAIFKGITGLALVLTVLIVAMYALTPVIVILAAFSTAILVLGAGLALAGAGMFLFATALAALAVSGAAGFAVLIVGIQSFLAMLPLIAQQFGLALVAFAKVIAVAAPKLIQAFTAIIMAMLKSIQTTVPEFIKTMGIILKALLDEIVKRAPQIYGAGLDLILGLLKAIRSRIAQITNVAIDIVVIFLQTLKSRLPNIIQAGIELVVSFLNGLAEGLRSHKDQIAQAGYNIGSAIVEGLIHGVSVGKDKVIQAAKDLADHLPSWVKKVLGISSPSKVFEQIGIFVNEGLIKGLTGNRDQVQAAFDHLKDVVRNAKDSAAKDIADYNAKIKKLNGELAADDKAIAAQRKALRDAENKEMVANANGKAKTAAQEKAFDEAKAKAIQAAKDKLEKLTEARNQDVAAINTAKAALAQARDEYAKSSDAYYGLTNAMGANVRELQSLADQVDANKTKIEEANKALDAAIKTRDDYKKQIADSFDALPDINKDTTLADYVAGMQAKTDNVTAFSTALQQLREYGLSDEMYQEFLKKGVDSLPFIQEVLKGGVESVNLINESSKNLATAADALGTMASQSMYQAGVDTAQGLLAGLQSQEAALEAEMARIAAIIAQKTKEELKIKSPSRVFMKIGAFTTEGLAKGMRDSSHLAVSAADDVSQNVVDALTKTISGMAELVPMNMDLQPTITPVLDFSNVKKDAALLGSILPPQQINVDTAYSRAAAANAAYTASQEAVVSTGTDESVGGDVIFNQTINSPKAPSAADVYRNTRNQISQAKEALTGAKSSGGS